MRTSIRTRLLVAFLAIAIAAAGGLSVYFLSELEQYALRNLEARLDAEAQLIAAMMGTAFPEIGLEQGGLTSEGLLDLDAALDDVGPRVTTRLRVLDEYGIAVADSTGEAGVSYLDKPEVVAALAGGYGAHTRVLDDGRVALYVARPIVRGGQIIGAVYSSSTTFSIMTLLRDYRTQLLWAGLLFVVVTVVVIELLVRWLAAPMRDLEAAANAVAAGDHSYRVQPSGARETRAAADAFNVMSAEIEEFVAELREEERRTARFVSDVSHELRTPLTSIRGAAETLAQGDVEDADSARFLGTIVRESSRLGRLADDLLVLQRIEGGTGELPISLVRLSDVVERTVEALAPLLEERGVAVDVTGSVSDVLGDRDRLQQVAANLIDNATRVTPSGGVVRVTLADRAGSATMSVQDAGPGIRPEDLPHLFERFYRTQPSRERRSGGAGLGLAIASAIVEAHGGTITASNGQAGGAIFEVVLPHAPG